MRTILIVLAIITTATFCRATTITRGNGKKEIRSRKLNTARYSNIFHDYGWSYPDLKSTQITIGNEGYNFSLNGVKYNLFKNENGSISINSNGAIISNSTEKSSKGECYFDKRILGTRTIRRQRWAPYTQYVGKMVPVTKYRSVTEYQWDYSTKSSHAVSKQQMYQDFEYRSTMQTSYRWETYYERVVDIPEYLHYTFTLNDSTNIILYHVNNNYYIQNASYMYAEDNDGLKYIFIDNNMNGSFTDPEDKAMFSSWNPYSRGSAYRKSLFLVSNKWYDINYLSEEYFIDFYTQNDNLVIDYKNEKYVNSSEKGNIAFQSLPGKANITINGKKYDLGNREKGYKIEYGMYKVTISQKEYLDYDTVLIVDEKTPHAVVKYQNTGLACKMEIKNIYSDGYFVNVSNENGFRKTYYNSNKVEMPSGKNKIEIFTDGITIEKNVTINPGDNEILNYEDELKKVLPPAEEQKKE